VNPFISLGKKFKEELEGVVAQVLANHGVNANSELVKSLEFTDNNRTDALFMIANDYYQSVSTGRRPRVRKIPIYALITWVKRNNLGSGQSVNQIAYRMQNAIYRNGIRGKNFLEKVEGSVLDLVEIRVADTLEEDIAESLYTAFKIK
jgi:hypothetical protein